ncbi:MAG TPA: VOC family protein [Pseudonocardiaceae bacterium]
MEMTSYKPGTPSWVDLGSPDQDESAAFYGAVFGWDIPEGPPEAGGYRMCLLRGKPVAGLGRQQAPDIPPYWTTYVSVSDLDATVRAVEAGGGQLVVPAMDVLKEGRMAVFADPTGAPFSAWQPGDHIGSGYANEPGAVSWNELVTRNTDRAIVFYSEVFGWTADAQGMGDITYTVWMLDGNPVGGMMPMGDQWPAEVPPHWAVYFAVEDTDATVAKVTALGGSVVVPPQDIPQGRFAGFSDPHGAMFNVIALAG